MIDRKNLLDMICTEVFEDNAIPEAEMESKHQAKDPFAVTCVCGNHYSLHMHTVCPECARWPRAENENAPVGAR